VTQKLILNATILSIGSELLSGEIADTNAAWLADALLERGILLRHALSCDDQFPQIQDAATFLLERSDLVIVSGGLGPTDDDLTREALAQLFNMPLEMHHGLLDSLKQLFQSRGRTFVKNNERQALIPRGAEVIPNPIGTAAGFMISVEYAGKPRLVAALPGVPKEFKIMLNLGLFKSIEHLLPESTYKRSFFRTFGLPESVIGQRVAAVPAPPEVSVAYRAHFPEVQVKLRYPTNLNSEVTRNIEKYTAKIREAIGADYIFSENSKVPLNEVVHNLLVKSSKTISVAESCTAGGLGAALTELSGSSNFFLGGIQSYSNQIKNKLLGVPQKTLDTYGAVSAECAEQMARGVRKKLGSDIALSITGIAGPEGGTPEKPVGTFYIGFATATENGAYRYFYPQSRDMVRTYSIWCALDILRRYLLELPVVVKVRYDTNQDDSQNGYPKAKSV